MDITNWFTGVVEDVGDPLQQGRVRVRCFGYHTDDTAELPKEDLPWSTCIMPVTSPGVSGVGQSATGLLPGSWVFGFFRDGRELQDPVIIGSIASVSGSNSGDIGQSYSDPYGVFPVAPGNDTPLSATSNFQNSDSYTAQTSEAQTGGESQVAGMPISAVPVVAGADEVGGEASYLDAPAVTDNFDSGIDDGATAESVRRELGVFEEDVPGGGQAVSNTVVSGGQAVSNTVVNTVGGSRVVSNTAANGSILDIGAAVKAEYASLLSTLNQNSEDRQASGGVPGAVQDFGLAAKDEYSSLLSTILNPKDGPASRVSGVIQNFGTAVKVEYLSFLSTLEDPKDAPVVLTENREKTIQAARSAIGIIETRPGYGPGIDEFWKATNQPNGYGEKFWGPAFVCWCIQKSSMFEDKDRPKTPSARGFEAWARSLPFNVELKFNPSNIFAGNLVIFSPNHIGIAITESDANGKFKSIEGNTTTEKGNGVFEKDRSLSQVKSALIIV